MILKMASGRPFVNKKQSATDSSGSHCAWAKTIGNFSVSDYLRPERNCDDFKTIWKSRRSKKKQLTVARVEQFQFVRRDPDGREPIAGANFSVVVTWEY